MQTPTIVAAISEQLRQWSETLDPDLRCVFDALNRGSGVDADKGAAPYLDATSQPVLALPLWLGEGIPSDTVCDVAGSALAAYLAVRLQDDWIDEGKGDPALAWLLFVALKARHVDLVGRHAQDARYWALHGELWSRYAAAMTLEKRLAAENLPCDEAAFTTVLDKSAPLLLPGAALLLASGRWHDLPLLSTLISSIVRAHQLFDDLKDALDDFGRGQRTYVLWLAGATTKTELASWMLRGGVDRIIAETEQEVDRAIAASQGLKLAKAETWLRDRRQAASDWQKSLFQRYFDTVVKD